MRKFGNIVLRYGVSTFGIAVAALGVGLSLKSNLGIAPLSCIPTVLGLEFPAFSVGTFTWAFNLLFILFQLLILRRDFRWEHLLQVVPVLIFGYLVDGAIWLFNALDAPSSQYVVQILLCLASVALTAVGIRIEVSGGGWILPADSFLNVLSERSSLSFGTLKVGMDVALVVLTAALSLLFFGHWTGNGTTVVIREGTVILAVLTGLCMKITDPVVDRVCKRIVKA